MKNYVKLLNIKIKNSPNISRIEYQWESNGIIKDFLNNNTFYIEYNFNLQNIPKSILAIPFIANILPLIWITNSTLIIDELDLTFYKNIPKIKHSYQKMIKKINLKGKIIIKKLINNQKETNSNKKLCFFSGGVDSTSSLINHLRENITTLTIWGSDITTKNTIGWENVHKHILKNTNTLGIKANFCKSSFRNIINYDNINKIIIPKINDNYWHAYQHSLAILSHAAPLCYKNNIKTIYFPATRSYKYQKHICASVPEIDNNFIFANTKTIHDGFALSRLDKIKNIVTYNHKSKNKVSLRVCWQSLNGLNCTHCEKCFRTILELLTIAENPKLYNFDILNNTYDLIKYDTTHLDNKTAIKYYDYYHEIKETIKDNQADSKLKWMLDCDKF